VSDIKAIEFIAEVRQVKTMADGSFTVYLNMPEMCLEQAKVLLGWHHLAVRGVLAVEKDEDGESGKRGKIHI